MNRSRRLAAPLLVAAVLLAGCSGVPTTSPPQTIRAVGEDANQAPAPPRGADPRDLVTNFLGLNYADPQTLAAARQYLTPAMRKTWAPTVKATVITNWHTGSFTSKGTVTVSGQALGTLSADGSYTPLFNEQVSFTYHVGTAENGQYLINQVPPGLVIPDVVFNRFYFARPVFFFDTAEKYLVPFVRYSALVDQKQLANWLLNLLGNPPGSVSPQGLPSQAHRLTVKIDGLRTKVQVPGSRQLDPDARDRFAAQVSQTLAKSNIPATSISIDDGTGAISIRATRSTTFSASDFAGELGPLDPPHHVYYVRNGRIVDQYGKLLAGPVNDGHFFYTSVALASRTVGDTLSVAAVVGSGDQQRLLVGTTTTGMRATAVLRGTLSRPAWAPGRNEVWIADGPRLFRVDTSGATPVVLRVASQPGVGGGRIVALRLSPDGARIAIVVSGSHGQGQIFIGSVVRGTGAPQVVGLQTISPDTAVITDVAWDYAQRLTAIGYPAPHGDARVYEVGVDGANWTERVPSGLPAAPVSLAASSDGAWVSADGYVWTRSPQSASAWISPGPTGQTQGTNPVYLG